MRNETFRLIIACVIVAGVLVLNNNFSLTQDEVQEENVMACIEVEESAEEARDESINYMKTTPETVTSAVSDEEVLWVEESVAVTNPNLLSESYEEGEVKESIVLNAAEEPLKLVQVDDVIENSNLDISIETGETEVETPQTLDERAILMLLADSKVVSTDRYTESIGMDTVRVFAEDISDFFSMNMAPSYNLWGNNMQCVSYSMRQLQTFGDSLSFDIGLTGDSATDMVKFYVFMDNAELPSQEFTLEAGEAPKTVTLSISDCQSIKLVADNRTGNFTQLVGFNFRLQ